MTEQSNETVETTEAEHADTHEHEIQEWTGEEDEPKSEEQPSEELEKSDEPDQSPEPEKTEKKTHAQERYEQILRENAELKRKQAEIEAKNTASELKRPNIEDYDSYADYEDAVDNYNLAKAEQRVLEKLQKQEQSKSLEKQQLEMQTAIAEIEADGIDFKSYMQKADELPQLPLTLDQFGLSAKDTLMLAKDLLDDEETYIALSKMSVAQASMKIGQIIGSKQAEKAPPKQVSKAPKPITPVNASAAASRSAESMTDDEWYNEYTKQRKQGK